MALSHAVLTATKHAPTMSEIAISISFLISQIDHRTLACTSKLLPIAALTTLLSALAARPLLARWLDGRELNPNFFYAATVALGAGQLLAIYDVAAAALQAEAEEREAGVGAACVQRAWRRHAAREKSD